MRQQPMQNSTIIIFKSKIIFYLPMKITKFIKKRYKSQLESKLSTTHLSVSPAITVFFGAALRGKMRRGKGVISAGFSRRLGVGRRAFRGFGALQLAGFSC
jgi:hypothetical protein